MGEKLSGGNVAIALLANTIATGAALAALILTFDSISGAHFNPVVSVVEAISKALPWTDAAAYVAVQITGGVCGTVVAHLMFGRSVFSISHHDRHGWPTGLSEVVATFGSIVVIACCSCFRSSAVAYAVAGYITAAYWFTASTTFANPAVTIARSWSDTFAGIQPVDVPLFVAAQVVGGLGAMLVARHLLVPAVNPARVSDVAHQSDVVRK